MAGQRRKKGGRTTPKGCAPIGRLTQSERASLEEVFGRLLRSAAKELTDDLPALVAEIWASQIWSIWEKQELIGMDAVAVFGGGLIEHASKASSPAALAVLRALGSVAPEPYGSKARRAADRLAASGSKEPAWGPVVGGGQPTGACLLYDPVDDDGVMVLAEFDGPGDASTVGVYVDHNLGGIAKDLLAVPAGINQVVAVQGDHDESQGIVHRAISLDEAAARWREGLAMTDMTLEPPVSEDFDGLRALVESRLDRLPPGRHLDLSTQMSEEQRDELLQEFLESDETTGLWDAAGDDNEHDAVEHLAHQILSFSLDYNLGTPLRFSPVMVEIFCLDWAPRKIAIDGDGFTLLPDVLAAWIRFVGRRRAIPEEAIKAAVSAAYRYAPEMIELSQDPTEWGPAKTVALAIQQRGIDLTDQAALDSFLAEVNRNGGIYTLADSLAVSVAPRR
jgi:hypothetical protein